MGSPYLSMHEYIFSAQSTTVQSYHWPKESSSNDSVNKFLQKWLFCDIIDWSAKN